MTRFFKLRYCYIDKLRIQLTLLITAIILTACQSGDTRTGQSTQSSHDTHSSSSDTTQRIPAHFESVNAARPLPAVLDPAMFQDPVVSKAYSFARANPEIFAQQPCYCYCDDGFGHKSLLDCFATDHSAG